MYINPYLICSKQSYLLCMTTIFINLSLSIVSTHVCRGSFVAKDDKNFIFKWEIIINMRKTILIDMKTCIVNIVNIIM